MLVTTNKTSKGLLLDAEQTALQLLVFKKIFNFSWPFLIGIILASASPVTNYFWISTKYFERNRSHVVIFSV